MGGGSHDDTTSAYGLLIMSYCQLNISEIKCTEPKKSENEVTGFYPASQNGTFIRR